MTSSCVAPISGDDLPMVDRHTAAAAWPDGKVAHSQAARNIDVAWERTGIAQAGGGAG